MKKSIFLSAIVCAVLGMFVGCSTPDSKPVTYIGEKLPSEPKAVGDIVFNDGSATPYTKIMARTENDAVTGKKVTKAEKDAAIAVIFYVGTNCSNDSRSRTLGVGLEIDRPSVLDCPWCRWNSKDDKGNAYNIEVSSIGCFVNGANDSFEVTVTGDKDGSDNFEEIAKAIKTNGRTDDTSDATKYPAFHFAKNYKNKASNLTSTYENGWYLPSIAELLELGKIFDDINEAVDASGHLGFSLTWYWSSSQNDHVNDNAWYIDFNDLLWGSKEVDKKGFYALAIREF